MRKERFNSYNCALEEDMKNEKLNLAIGISQKDNLSSELQWIYERKSGGQKGKPILPQKP